MEEDDAMVLVAPPEDPQLRAVIDLLAEFIATDGDAFEKVITNRIVTLPFDRDKHQHIHHADKHYHINTTIMSTPPYHYHVLAPLFISSPP